MALAARRRILFLALIIAVSHAALAAHSATHSDPDTVLQCRLCLCQAEQSHSLPAVVIDVAVVAGRAPQESTLLSIEWACVATRAYYQRAPPSIA